MGMLSAFARGVADTLDATAAVDIVIVATLIYLGLLGLQRVRTGLAMRGALMLGAVYLIARQFSLELTSAALEAFLGILLIALIMIYRQELRQLVERVARLARRPSSITPNELPLATLLSDVAFDLAAVNWGALIVIAGEDAVGPHLHGGTPLGGEPSSPLIKSIFDPSSVGHDGALVIERGVVTRFSVHLPLSQNVDALGELGTRHAAALGLAEHCDALCIVVSEERGSVSVARRGRLQIVGERSDLADILRSRLGDGEPAEAGWSSLFSQHHGTKLAALVLAAIAWLVLVYGGQITQQTIVTSIKWRDLGAELELLDVNPDEVRIVASGARRDFALSSRSPARVLISLADLGQGEHRVVVSSEDVMLPKGLSLKSVAPGAVYVAIRATGSATPAVPPAPPSKTQTSSAAALSASAAALSASAAAPRASGRASATPSAQRPSASAAAAPTQPPPAQ